MDNIIFENNKYKIKKVFDGRIIYVYDTDIENDNFNTKDIAIKISNKGYTTLIDNDNIELDFNQFINKYNIKQKATFIKTIDKLISECMFYILEK